jgi:hypothetical protein
MKTNKPHVRVCYLSQTHFTENEMLLIGKVCKCSIGTPQINNLESLISQMENTIKQIDENQQEAIMYLVANNLQWIIYTNKKTNQTF